MAGTKRLAPRVLTRDSDGFGLIFTPVVVDDSNTFRKALEVWAPIIARRRDDGALVSSGGRVLSVVGTGADLSAARASAYATLDSIRLPGSHFRTDIALAAAEGRISL